MLAEGYNFKVRKFENVDVERIIAENADADILILDCGINRMVGVKDSFYRRCKQQEIDTTRLYPKNTYNSNGNHKMWSAGNPGAIFFDKYVGFVGSHNNVVAGWSFTGGSSTVAELEKEIAKVYNQLETVRQKIAVLETGKPVVYAEIERKADQSLPDFAALVRKYPTAEVILFAHPDCGGNKSGEVSAFYKKEVGTKVDDILSADTEYVTECGWNFIGDYYPYSYTTKLPNGWCAYYIGWTLDSAVAMISKSLAAYAEAHAPKHNIKIHTYKGGK